mgnify:FL=1
MVAYLGNTSNEVTTLLNSNVFLRGLATRYASSNLLGFETWDNLGLTYQFRKEEQAPTHSTTLRWNDNLGSSVEKIFSQIESISNLSFTEVSENADINFWLYFDDDNTLGYSYGIAGAGIFINSANIQNHNFPSGGMDHLTVAHEIMHNLGMTHPFDGYANFPGVNSTYDLGDLNSSQNIFTITSYNDQGTLTANSLKINPENSDQVNEFGLSNLGVIDQFFLQTLYGSNELTNADDTSFFFNIDDKNQNWKTIWDSGGVDTIRFEGEQPNSVFIDLRSPTLDLSNTETTFSGICTVKTDNTWGGFIIGHGVDIENASSGFGNDNITGNNLNNFLQSSGGDNIFIPNLGNDFIKSGDGADIIYLQSNELWTSEFVALHTITINTSTYERINLAGYNKFTDHIFSGGGIDKIYLTETDDALFLDDHYSSSNSSIHYESSELGLPSGILPRLMTCEEIYGMGGSDILDFTSPVISATELFLNGGEGDDILWAGAQNDILEGGAGNDVLNGGPGDDLISGGSGADQFKFAGLFGNDTISDWEIGVDTLLLHNINASEVNIYQNSILYGSENSIIFSNLSDEEVLSISIDFI